MRRDYAAHYRRLYERHWWWRAREEIVYRHLVRLAPPGGFGPILDVGCGDGLFFPRLGALGVPEGVEEDAALVTDAGRTHGTIHVGPFDASFRPAKRYRLVLLLDVLEHVRDDAACLRRAVELLAPDGRVVITVPALPALWTAHDDVNGHLRRYTRRTLVRVADAAGLRVEHAEYLFQWAALAKLAVRTKEALAGSGGAVPRIPGPVPGALLRAAALVEHAALHRLPVPFGSSLLAIGRAA